MTFYETITPVKNIEIKDSVFANVNIKQKEILISDILDRYVNLTYGNEVSNHIIVDIYCNINIEISAAPALHSLNIDSMNRDTFGSAHRQ